MLVNYLDLVHLPVAFLTETYICSFLSSFLCMRANLLKVNWKYCKLTAMNSPWERVLFSLPFAIDCWWFQLGRRGLIVLFSLKSFTSANLLLWVSMQGSTSFGQFWVVFWTQYGLFFSRVCVSMFADVGVKTNEYIVFIRTQDPPRWDYPTSWVKSAALLKPVWLSQTFVCMIIALSKLLKIWLIPFCC